MAFRQEIEAYIRQAAQKRGIDPDVAVRVAMSEGGLNDPFRQGESMLSYGREESYGPFQLHMRGGGVGERALKAGIDPRKNWQGGVDYALDEAAQKGWGQWFGAAKAGIGNRTGLGNARATGVDAGLSPEAMDFVKNNPQPGGYGPGVPDPNSSSVFGAMAPSPSASPTMPGSAPFSIDPNAAAVATGDKPATFGDRLSAAGKHFEDAFATKPAPAPPMPGDARASGDSLLKFLANPNALAQFLMKQRMGGAR